MTMTSEPRRSLQQEQSPGRAVNSNGHLGPTGQPDSSFQVSQMTPTAPLGTPSTDRRAPMVIWRWLRANTFVPHWLPARWRTPATGYLLVVALQVMAAMITHLLLRFFSTYAFPGALELLVVVLTALSFGAGPSLFATLLGVVLEEVVVLPILVGEVGLTTGDLVEVVVFLAIGISISLVASASEQSRRLAVQERSQAQERELAAMRQVQERMDAFLAIASHDLRQPVTTAIGFIDIAIRRMERLAAAARDTESDLIHQIEAVQASIRDASQSGKRLSRMVNMLFDTSLARAGELKIQPTACDLAALVRELVEGQRVSSANRIIRLQVSSPGPIWVMADAARIGQVVSNFLSNALKYSPSDQAVDVQLTVTDGWARVAVEDRGPGLPPTELERVWQRFYRVVDVSTQGGGASDVTGLGVGLHISKTVIELHGGKVGVESIVGHGSTFWFALPLDKPAALHSPELGFETVDRLR